MKVLEGVVHRENNRATCNSGIHFNGTFLHIERTDNPRMVEDDEPTIGDIVKVIKERQILESKENLEKLLLIITNFIKFKC